MFCSFLVLGLIGFLEQAECVKHVASAGLGHAVRQHRDVFIGGHVVEQEKCGKNGRRPDMSLACWREEKK